MPLITDPATQDQIAYSNPIRCPSTDQISARLKMPAGASVSAIYIDGTNATQPEGGFRLVNNEFEVQGNLDADHSLPGGTSFVFRPKLGRVAWEFIRIGFVVANMPAGAEDDSVTVAVYLTDTYLRHYAA